MANGIALWNQSAQSYGIYENDPHDPYPTLTLESTNQALKKCETLKHTAIKCMLVALLFIAMTTTVILMLTGTIPIPPGTWRIVVLSLCTVPMGLSALAHLITGIDQLVKWREKKKLPALINEIEKEVSKDHPRGVSPDKAAQVVNQVLKSQCTLLNETISNHEYTIFSRHLGDKFIHDALAMAALVISHHRQFAAQHPEYCG